MHRAEILCEGILNTRKNTVDSTVLSKDAIDEMYQSVTAKLPTNKKIAFRKEDAMKNVRIEN